MLQFDIPLIFETFGGNRDILTLFERYALGHDLTYGRIQMWRHRGRIPSKYTPPLLDIMEREGYSWRHFAVEKGAPATAGNDDDEDLAGFFEEP